MVVRMVPWGEKNRLRGTPIGFSWWHVCWHCLTGKDWPTSGINRGGRGADDLLLSWPGIEKKRTRPVFHMVTAGWKEMGPSCLTIAGLDFGAGAKTGMPGLADQPVAILVDEKLRVVVLVVK